MTTPKKTLTKKTPVKSAVSKQTAKLLTKADIKETPVKSTTTTVKPVVKVVKKPEAFAKSVTIDVKKATAKVTPIKATSVIKVVVKKPVKKPLVKKIMTIREKLDVARPPEQTVFKEVGNKEPFLKTEKISQQPNAMSFAELRNKMAKNASALRSSLRYKAEI